MKPVTPPEEGQTLAERYGTGARSSRRVVTVMIGALLLLALAWLGWAIWSASTPDVQSSMRTYTVVNAHQVRAEVAVHTRSTDVRATCTLRAFGEDHSTVGEGSFVVRGVQGTVRRELVFRTEREATSVELVGCTSADQKRPR